MRHFIAASMLASVLAVDASGAGFVANRLFVQSQVNTTIQAFEPIAAAPGYSSVGSFTGNVGTFVAFGPGNLLYVCSNTGVRILDETGTLLDTIVGGGLAAANGLVFGPGGDLFVVSNGTNEINRYRHSAGSWSFQSSFALTGMTNASGLAFGPNGNLFVTASGTTDEVFEFDPIGGAKITRFGAGLLDSPLGLAFVPQRSKAKLSGTLAVPGFPASNDKESVFLNIAPGSRTILIEMRDLDNVDGNFLGTFLQEALVAHGFENAEDDGAKRRVFGGAQVGSFTEGLGNASLTVTGKPNSFGDYVIKSATGSVNRHGASGGYNATITTSKFLNKP